MTSSIPTGAIKTAAVVDWIQRKAPGGPGAWGAERLGRWLTSRQGAGNLWIVVVGSEPQAIGVATEREDGAIHVELMIAEHRDLWSSLLNALMRRWPDWRDRRFTAVRRGQERPFPMEKLIDRMEVRPWM